MALSTSVQASAVALLAVAGLKVYSILALVVVCLGACTPNPLTRPADRGASSQPLEDAKELARAHDWPKAHAAIRAIIEGRSFRSLSSHDQFQALWLGASVGMNHGDKHFGYKCLLRVVAMPEAGFDQWATLLSTAAELRDAPVEVRSLTMLAQRWPEQTVKMDPIFIGQVVRKARQLPHSVSLPLLKSLYGAHWQLRSNVEPSVAWRDLALLLLENNQRAEATDVSTHVTDPYVLISMRADHRFDEIVATHPDQFEINEAAMRELHSLEKASENSPLSLELRVRTLGALERQRHYEAMLASADSILLAIRSTNFPEKAFEDYIQQYSRFLEYRATALERVGRWDDGLAEMIVASQLRENGRANVSQVLDLARLYCELGRPSEAVSVVGKAGSDLSAYGSMQKEFVLLWAAVQSSDGNQKTLSMKYLKSHQADAPDTYWTALLIANKSDEAAALFVARLRDGDLRQDALEDAQDYAASPSTPILDALASARQSVLARQDVQAAIRSVGKVESYALLAP